MPIREYATKWFEERKKYDSDIEVKEYQLKILEDIDRFFYDEKELQALLGACVRAGKTYIAICYLDFYFKYRNKNGRIIILTHRQNFLRNQFYDDMLKLKPDFGITNICKLSSGKNYRDSLFAKVVITLPQTIASIVKKLGKFDILIVDEAHHGVFGPQFKKVFKTLSPSQTLYVTGSPWLHNRDKNLKKTGITVFELMAMGELETNINFVNSKINFKFPQNDFNEVLEIKTHVVDNLKEEKVKAILAETMSSLLNHSHSHLAHTSDVFGYSPYAVKTNILKSIGLPNAPDWEWLKKKKTRMMIACRTQRQARLTKEYLEEQGFSVVLSTSDTDRKSLEIDRFKKDKTISVLVVVMRGTIGYTVSDLELIIDLTFTQNPDRLYQMIGRLLLKHPDKKPKMFIKGVPNHIDEMEDYYDRVVMPAAFALFDAENYWNWDGKGFFEIKVRGRFNEPKNPNQISNERKHMITTPTPHRFDSITIFDEIYMRKINPHIKGETGIPYSYIDCRHLLNEHLNKILRNTYDKKYVFEDAAKYENKELKVWRKERNGPYSAAVRNKWIDEIIVKYNLKAKRKNKYKTKEQVVTTLKSMKKVTTHILQKNYPGLKSAAKNFGVEIETGFMRPPPIFPLNMKTAQQKIIFIKKMIKNKKISKNEFRTKHSNLYRWATRNKILEFIFPIPTIPTYEEAIKEIKSKKLNSVAKIKHGRAWGLKKILVDTIVKNGWLEKLKNDLNLVDAFQGKGGKNQIVQFSLENIKINRFESIVEAVKALKLKDWIVSLQALKKATLNKFIWKYEDENLRSAN